MKFISLIAILVINTFYLSAQNWTIYGCKVNDVAYDVDGSMWVVGNGGIYHQTPNGWVNFNSGNSPLPANEVLTVAVEASGKKWFGLQGYGIVSYDGTNWIQSNFISGPSVQNVVFDIQTIGNAIWAVGYYMLGKYDGTTWSYYVFNSNINLSFIADSNGNAWFNTHVGLAKYDGSGFTFIDAAYQNSSDAIAVDIHNNYWMYADTGLVKYDGSNFQYFPANYDYFKINSIFVDRNDDIWLGERGGLHKFSGGVWTDYDTSNSPLIDISTFHISEGLNGGILINQYTGGLLTFDGNTWQDLSIHEWMNDKSFYSTAYASEDPNGNYWSASFQMIAKINSGNVTHFNLRELGFSNVTFVRKIFFYNNIIWLGTDKGIITFDGTNWNRISGTQIYDFWDIVKDPIDSVLYFASNGGLLNYDGVTLKNLSHLFNGPNNAYGIAFDNSNKIWLATYGHGLYEYKDTIFTSHSLTFPLYFTNVYSIAVDQNNHKCLATPAGYYEVDDVTGQILDSAFTTKAIRDVAVDAMNNKWIAGDMGVAKISNGQITLYNDTNSALPFGQAYCVEIDQMNRKIIADAEGGLVILDDFGLGVKENVYLSHSLVYPNPASNQLNLKFSNQDVNEIMVYDYSGRVVMNYKIAHPYDTYQIDISALTNGYYLVKTIGQQSTSSSRFIKVN